MSSFLEDLTSDKHHHQNNQIPGEGYHEEYRVEDSHSNRLDAIQQHPQRLVVEGRINLLRSVQVGLVVSLLSNCAYFEQIQRFERRHRLGIV